jgi:hypothetical protein
MLLMPMMMLEDCLIEVNAYNVDLDDDDDDND